jgi:hypothetical protein
MGILSFGFRAPVLAFPIGTVASLIMRILKLRMIRTLKMEIVFVCISCGFKKEQVLALPTPHFFNATKVFQF